MSFNYKILLTLLILIFPNLIILFIPFPIYDGMRLFLWVLPYFCIIPALTIYYLIENFKFIQVKFISILMSLLIFFHLFNFFTITPYQYTYLNFLNGKAENRYKKMGVKKTMLLADNLMQEFIMKIKNCLKLTYVEGRIELHKLYLKFLKGKIDPGKAYMVQSVE